MRGQRHTERTVELSSGPTGTSAAVAVAGAVGVTEAEYETAVGALWKPQVRDTGALADWNAREELQDVIGAVVRLTRPMVVVETGVAMGLTCAVILAALDSNGDGQLYSVDLPALQSRPEEFVGSAVPDKLKSRWTLERVPRARFCRPWYSAWDRLTSRFTTPTTATPGSSRSTARCGLTCGWAACSCPTTYAGRPSRSFPRKRLRSRG
jgi:hypothetical protein